MKISLIYNPKDPKLSEDSYSLSYRDQLFALIDRFDEVQHISQSCSAKDIDADVIIFYDPHSSYQIEIDGIESHRAIKYTYMDDPYQPRAKFKHVRSNQIFVKLGPKGRIERARKRGIDYIICPYTELYYKYFGRFLNGDVERMFLWFPVVSDIRRYAPITKLSERKPKVLANGAIHHLPHFKGYEFRKWAFSQPEVFYIAHCFANPQAPRGTKYARALLSFAGALALCDTHTPPKYTEIPMAGCVCFAQYQKDYERMGFKDSENCFIVTKKNFTDTITAFRHDVEQYQNVADAGRKLIEEKWTAEKFADFIYNHAQNGHKNN